MPDQYTPLLSDEERAFRRAQRIKARKQRQRARRRRLLRQLLPVAALFLIGWTFFTVWGRQSEPAETEPASVPPVQTAVVLPEEADAPEEPVKPVEEVPAAIPLGEELDSSYAVLIDLQTNTVVAEKSSDVIINPASMTKLMTLLVAAEHITDLDSTTSVTIDITDYCFINECSVMGLEIGETVTLRELLYGTILPSGADASLALAIYLAGSHEAFVEMMNEKAAELELSKTTHFTNCVGLYDDAHKCTVYDMAIILKAAMDNELCREVLRARTYETVPTPEHPDGQILSNWFLRRIEDHDTGDIEVIGAKTGYVEESGSCAASCGEDPDGNRYICVTGDASSSWKAIYDHEALYRTYCQ